MPTRDELLKIIPEKVSRVKDVIQSVTKEKKERARESSVLSNTSQKRKHRPITPILNESSQDEEDKDNAVSRRPPNLISPQNRRDQMVKKDREESDEEENRARLDQDAQWQEYKLLQKNMMHGIQCDGAVEVDNEGFYDLCFSARTEFTLTQPIDANINIEDHDENK